MLRYGIPSLRRGIRSWNVEQSPVWTLLKEYPHHIVWIFEVPVKDNQQATSIHLWLVDGEKYALSVKVEDKDSLMKALSGFAPNARLGYQPEWVNEYKQDPSNFAATPKS